MTVSIVAAYIQETFGNLLEPAPITRGDVLHIQIQTRTGKLRFVENPSEASSVDAVIARIEEMSAMIFNDRKCQVVNREAVKNLRTNFHNYVHAYRRDIVWKNGEKIAKINEALDCRLGSYGEKVTDKRGIISASNSLLDGDTTSQSVQYLLTRAKQSHLGKKGGSIKQECRTLSYFETATTDHLNPSDCFGELVKIYYEELDIEKSNLMGMLEETESRIALEKIDGTRLDGEEKEQLKQKLIELKQELELLSIVGRDNFIISIFRDALSIYIDQQAALASNEFAALFADILREKNCVSIQQADRATFRDLAGGMLPDSTLRSVLPYNTKTYEWIIAYTNDPTWQPPQPLVYNEKDDEIVEKVLAIVERMAQREDFQSALKDVIDELEVGSISESTLDNALDLSQYEDDQLEFTMMTTANGSQPRSITIKKNSIGPRKSAIVGQRSISIDPRPQIMDGQ